MLLLSPAYSLTVPLYRHLDLRRPLHPTATSLLSLLPGIQYRLAADAVVSARITRSAAPTLATAPLWCQNAGRREFRPAATAVLADF